MPNMSDTRDATLVPAERVREQIRLVLTAWGMPEKQRETTVEVMVETDLRGVDSHGVSMLMMYDEMQRNGRLRIKAEPRIVRETATTALLDGGAGLGHPAADAGMRLAIEKCRNSGGVAIVSVVNSHHFGAAGYYAQLAAEAGLIGLVTSATQGITVAPTFGAEPVIGTNPIAFAAPARRNPPFVLDMATSTVAGNKVKVYELNGWPLPEGWVVDGEGRPITDAARARAIVLSPSKEGGLTPLGGTPELASHKGYGLAMMAHILGGALAGGSFSPIRRRTQKPSDPDNIGHFFLAVDPAAFREPDDFLDDVDEAIDVLHATKRADPAQPVLVAGDPERATRARRLEEGIPIPASLAAKIRDLAERAGTRYVLTL
jgi:LDH2 family malate/lactate/ureidoglycolate dehydrogenase